LYFASGVLNLVKTTIQKGAEEALKKGTNETFESRELYNKAEESIRRNNYREASVLLAEALKISPDNPLYISCRGLCVAMEGNPFAGKKMCMQAMNLAGPDRDPMLNVNLGRVQLLEGDRKNARDNFTVAYRLDQTNAPAALELSRMGVRKKPVISFLGRSHPLNVYLGRVRHRYREWRNPGLKKK